MKNYYLWLRNAQQGPYTLKQVQGMWMSGGITMSTLYWTEGKTDWCPLAELAAIIEQEPANTKGVEILSAQSQMKNQGMGLLLALLFPGFGGLYSGILTGVFGAGAIGLFIAGFLQTEIQGQIGCWFFAGASQLASLVLSFWEIDSYNGNILKRVQAGQ